MDAPVTAPDLATLAGLEFFLDDLVTPMRAALERDGQLYPFAVIMGRRNPQTGMPLSETAPIFVQLDMAMFENDRTKDGARFMLDGLLEAFDGVGIAFVSESWLVKIPDDGKGFHDLSTPPSRHPERVEVVSAICEHKSGGAIFYNIPIVRSEKLVTLGEIHKHHTQPAAGARFGNFFGQARSIEA